MTRHGDLQAQYDETLKCVRCGLCQAVCPVYAVERNEAAVARGKVQLVRGLLEGRLQATQAVRERLFLCLNCGACTANCPSGVAVSEVMLAGRAQLLREVGRPLVERLLMREGLASRRAVQMAGLGLALYKRSGLRWLAHRYELLRHLPQSVSRAEALLPSQPRPRPFAAEPPARPKYLVAYFPGCVSSVLYPDLARTVVAVLQRNGCQVVVPQGLGCCGAPHRAYGDTVAAEAREAENTQLLNDAGVEAVVTDCATCGAGLSGYSYLRLPVYDISEFLVEKLGLAAPERELPMRVTYHDPCHLARGQGVREAPRRLLAAIPGVDLVEMAEADRCCGGAGTFALAHAETAQQITERKVANAAATGASVVATGCPACLMQIGHGLRLAAARSVAAPTETAHPIELLARAYGQ
ncbi:MAG: (Fe-S)-binding protein [Chloroflexota bacterium]